MSRPAIIVPGVVTVKNNGTLRGRPKKMNCRKCKTCGKKWYSPNMPEWWTCPTCGRVLDKDDELEIGGVECEREGQK